jgi:hypothetical protein
MIRRELCGRGRSLSSESQLLGMPQRSLLLILGRNKTFLKCRILGRRHRKTAATACRWKVGYGSAILRAIRTRRT